MELTFSTKLKGTIALTDSFQLTKTLREDNSLYKFIWARKGTVTIDVDHQLITLQENDIISLTNLHHLEIKESEGDYMILLFNSNFYCIYGNDHEVSCSGFLFNGTSRIMHFRLSEEEKATCEAIITSLQSEFQVNDNLKEEMLRILLKHFIIHATRVARKNLHITPDMEESFNSVRRFYVLVDQHFKEKKQVQDYADMLCKSPKTLSHLLSLYNLPSPLKVIHQRVEAEAKRHLLYSEMTAKEIAHLLGFEDQASFSRFFKKVSGESITKYKRQLKESGKIDN